MTVDVVLCTIHHAVIRSLFVCMIYANIHLSHSKFSFGSVYYIECYNNDLQF
jgi:hypothetical protein